MVGWRARVGLMIPSSNTNQEPEFYMMAPEGVTFHTARMKFRDTSIAGLTEMVQNIDKAIDELTGTSFPFSLIAFMCTSGTFIKGASFDREVREKIEKMSGIAAETMSAACVQAMKEMKIENVAVGTAYTEEINQKEREFLEGFGFNIVTMKGLGIRFAMDREPPEVSYRLGKEIDRPEADGVFISCGGLRAAPIIEKLEKDIKKPVITSNQAMMWSILRRLNIREPIQGYGALLREHL